MKGENHTLVVTSTIDEVTGEIRPLFALPVQVCKAQEEPKSGLDVAAPSGAKRQQVYLDPATGTTHEDNECPRGIFVGDEFRSIPDEAIAEAKGRKSDQIFVEGRVALKDVDFTRAQGMYFLQVPAQGGAALAYRLLYEGLLPVQKGKRVTREAQALVVKRTPRTQEKLAVIYADEDAGCLRLVQLAFTGDLREPDAQVRAPLTVDVTVEQIEKVREVLDVALPDATEVLATARDDNREAVAALVEKAIDGEHITAPIPLKTTAAAVDLETALRASLAKVAAG